MLSRFPWFTYYGARAQEWNLSLYMMTFGGFIALPMDSFAGSPGLEAAGGIMPEWAWGSLFFSVGACNAYALHINGRAAWTPFLRVAAMLFSMATFIAFVVGFIKAAPHSTGLVTYLSMALLFAGSGLFSAARDAGAEIARWRNRG